MTWLLYRAGRAEDSPEPTPEATAAAAKVIASQPSPSAKPMILGTTLLSRLTADQLTALLLEAAKQRAGGSGDLLAWIRWCQGGRVVMLLSEETAAVRSVLEGNVPALAGLDDVFRP